MATTFLAWLALLLVHMVGRKNGLTVNWQRVTFQIDDINVLFIIIFSNESPPAIHD